jgi:hypothetical protein
MVKLSDWFIFTQNQEKGSTYEIRRDIIILWLFHVRYDTFKDYHGNVFRTTKGMAQTYCDYFNIRRK